MSHRKSMDFHVLITDMVGHVSSKKMVPVSLVVPLWNSHGSPFLLVCYANFCWLNWLSSSKPLNFTGAVLQSPLYASHSLTFWGGWTHLKRLHERLGLSPGRLCVMDDSGISILGAVTFCVIKHGNGTLPINGGVERCWMLCSWAKASRNDGNGSHRGHS